MSILRPMNESAGRVRRSTGRRSANANDAVWRATGIVSLLAIGAIHFLQIVPTFQATPLLGVAFLVLIAASLAVAARLVISGDHQAWVASALVAAAAIGGYLFTRVVSTPLDNQDVGNWSCMLGLAALFVETTLLALSANAAATAPAFQRAMAPARIGEEAGSTAAESSSAA
jgi:hypothetical protein